MKTLRIYSKYRYLPILRNNILGCHTKHYSHCFKTVRTKKLNKCPKLSNKFLALGAPVGGILFYSCLTSSLRDPTRAFCYSVRTTDSDLEQFEEDSIDTFKDKFVELLVALLKVSVQFLRTTYQIVRMTVRFLRICLTFGPLFVVYPMVHIIPSLQGPWYSTLLCFIQWSGPTFIKLGQWASTRRDLFSKEFCDILSTLHRDGTIHPWEHTEGIMMEAFGESWRTLCRIDSNYPVYSGCIGQVYKAYIKPDLPISGESDGFRLVQGKELPVAIKVLHPGVTELVNMDLGVMHAIARIVSLVPYVEWLSLPDIVKEFEKLMKKQIDFTEEAKNLDIFNRNFSKVSNVCFPVPMWPYVRPSVLIESFEEGIPMSDFIMPEDTAISVEEKNTKKVLAKMGVDAMLKMVFADNFVHADLHPGNILVQLPEDRRSETAREGLDQIKNLRLVFLDAGIIASLEPNDFRNFRSVFTAIVLNRGHEVADLFLKHSRIHNCKNVEEFRNKMASLVNDVHNQTTSMGLLKVSQLFNDLFTLLMKHQILLESNMASIIWGIMVLEGLGRSLDPQIDLIQAARPVLVRQLLG